MRSYRSKPLISTLRSGQALLMDGAMGTELVKKGLPPGENPVAWNLQHPERVRAAHEAYRRAGAGALLTNTFLIHAASLRDTLPSADLAELWQAAYDLIGPGVYRLASLGPVAGSFGGEEFADWDLFSVRPEFFAPADGILLETCSSPRVRYAVARLQRVCDKPILLSLAYRRNAAGELVTESGHPPEWFARRAREYGVTALGVNCGHNIAMSDIAQILHRYRSVTDLPLFARPNAGTPQRSDGRWVYPRSAADMARALPALLGEDIAMIGGCCGTTPAHIAAFRKVLSARW